MADETKKPASSSAIPPVENAGNLWDQVLKTHQAQSLMNSLQNAQTGAPQNNPFMNALNFVRMITTPQPQEAAGQNGAMQPMQQAGAPAQPGQTPDQQQVNQEQQNTKKKMESSGGGAVGGFLKVLEALGGGGG